MADLPTMEELIKAVGRLKTGKAGGSSGILPEMVKAACSDSDFLELLLSMEGVTSTQGVDRCQQANDASKLHTNE